MNYLTYQLLIQKEIEEFISNLKKENNLWEDGKKTAGSHASKVKNNLQLDRESEISKKLSFLIKKKLLSNPLIKSFALPKNRAIIQTSKINMKIITVESGLIYFLKDIFE